MLDLTGLWVFVILIVSIFIYRRLGEVLRKIDGLEQRFSSSAKQASIPLATLPRATPVTLEQTEVSVAPTLELRMYPDAVEVVAPSAPPEYQAPLVTSVAAQDSADDPLVKVFAWFKEDWAMKIGAFFLILASIWFAQYAIQENWIGPVGRITMGVVIGIGVLAFGWNYMKREFNQGSIFLVLGSTMVIATLAASRFAYPDMLVPVVALGLMFMTSLFISFVGVQYRSKVLVVLSLVISGFLPLLMNSAGNMVGLFAYLLVVIFSTIWVAWVTDYREVVVIAQGMLLLYSFPALTDPVARVQILPMIYTCVATFFIAHVYGYVRGRIIQGQADVLVGILNLVLLLAWVINVAPREWQSLILAAWTLVFSLGAYVSYRASRNILPFAVYAVAGTVLLAVATIVHFEGSKLALVFTLEIGFLSFLSYQVRKNLPVSEKLALFMIVPFMLGITSILSSEWNTGAIHLPFFTLFFIAVVSISLGAYFLSKKSEFVLPQGQSNSSVGDASVFIIVGGSLYALILVWKFFHAIVGAESAAVMYSLVVYTIAGLIAYAKGLKLDIAGLRTAGAILLGLVTARLLLVDVRQMEMAGRFLTFLIVGILFLSSAFYVKSMKRSKSVMDPNYK